VCGINFHQIFGNLTPMLVSPNTCKLYPIGGGVSCRQHSCNVMPLTFESKL
jgi:hypothetical protein